MGVQRTVLFRGLLLAFLTFVVVVPARAASIIGLYTDENGSSCSFSGNQSGVVNAYVIVKPDNLGIRGVRFSAPVPACFGGSWISDTVPVGAASIGDSPTGISVAFNNCAAEPALVLQIQYLRTSSTPCCEFPIAIDPYVGIVEGVTCTYDEASMTPIVAHFNSNSTCPCSDPNPPHPPQDPVPTNAAVAVGLDTWLSWSHSSLDGDIVSYDVYFGTSATPPFVANVTVPAYQPPQALEQGQIYYWRIVVRDVDGYQATGPVWAFTTRLSNSPPAPPTSPSPANNATNVQGPVTLRWSASSDPNGDAVIYDVYLGTTLSPPLVAQTLTTPSYFAGQLAFNTKHYWRIVARDAVGAQSPGATWAFTTGQNTAPQQPTNPSPAAGATSVPVNATLSWTSSDDQPGLKYDVYFGTTTTPPLVASNITPNTYNPGTLSFSTQYRWKIVARDATGLTTAGVLWTFFTAAPPAAYSPTPADNGFGAAPALTLSWLCSRPNPLPVHCDLYFGTSNPPPLVASAMNPIGATTTFSYTPAGTVTVGTQYYWRVYAYDALGSTMGPVWSFTGALKGDIDRDGALTLDDAACALQIALKNSSCAVGETSSLADVNCDVGVTPRDALCIHRRAIGQTCLFCGESQAASPTTGPVVTRSAYWQTGNVIYVRLAVSGVPALEAFSFDVRTPTNAPLTSAVPVGATSGFTALATNISNSVSYIGGYALAAADGSSTTDFIELQFTVSGSMTGFILAENFVDDLYGVGAMTIISGNGKGGGGETPVLFTHFGAAPDQGGVRVSWQIRSVAAAAESYTVYRHQDGKAPLAITTGTINGETGSFLDRTVEVGRTYRYEMLVHTAEGDDVRSQLVAVTVATLGLALSPNHPNPFNPQTTIPYYVPAGDGTVRVRLAIYDTSGRAVRVLVDENQPGGPRDVVWRGDDETGVVVSSGIYFCVLQVGNERRTQKLVLLK